MHNSTDFSHEMMQLQVKEADEAVPPMKQVMESKVQRFYNLWGVSKSQEDVQRLAGELVASEQALSAFNTKLRARYHGTDLSSTEVFTTLTMPPHCCSTALLSTAWLLDHPGDDMTVLAASCLVPLRSTSRASRMKTHWQRCLS